MNTALKNKVEKTKVFIVDDHPIVRQGLAQLINQESDMISVGEAGTSDEALKSIAKIKPDVAIVDISLQGTSGIELTKNLVANYPKTLVLILSMYDESLHVERVLKAGAKGYLMKQSATDYVTTAIRKVVSGDIYVSDRMKETLMHQFSGGGKSLIGATTGKLSDRELEVLRLIGQGYATNRIAESLFVSVKTIESHYANIKNKLDLKNSHELIQYAVKWCLAEK
ncbi:MAG: response regulator transcription factor [Deltaproteobacteria bacterium]|nr:response regulator transcription factor [Deltaproteobacteria bacterium]